MVTISQVSGLRAGTPVELKCQIEPQSKEGDRWWLKLSDATGTVYGYGQRFSGTAVVRGVTGFSQNGAYISITDLQPNEMRPKKRKSLPELVIVGVVFGVIIGLLVVTIPFALPDFSYKDYYATQDVLELSDLEKDQKTSYKLLDIWNQAGQLCTEIRNTGDMVVGQEDLKKFRFIVDGVSYDWDKSTLPEKVGYSKRFVLCVCNGVIPDNQYCSENATIFDYRQVNGIYPSVAVQVQPFYGIMIAPTKVG